MAQTPAASAGVNKPTIQSSASSLEKNGEQQRWPQHIRPTAAASASASASAACESCHSSPGIPCCRVEWSFLCSSCAPRVHAHNWIVPINPNPNCNPSPYSYPFSYPFPYSFPNPIPNPNPSPAANGAAAVQVAVSSDEERDGSGRMKSVRRYMEKRKTRRFEKTLRYANRKAHADMRLRVGGKFVKLNGNVDGDGKGGVGDENERNDSNASQDIAPATERGDGDNGVV